MGYYVHFSACFSSDLDEKEQLTELVERFKGKSENREADWLLDAILDERNYNCGPKGSLFTWGIVGNYTRVDEIVKFLAPFFEEQLRRELGPLDHDHIVLFQEAEQTEQAECWELFLDRNELTIRHHTLPFCWGQF